MRTTPLQRGAAATLALTLCCASAAAQGALTHYGPASPGANFAPQIRGVGEPQVGNADFQLELYDAQPSTSGTLLLGTAPASVFVAGVTILNTAEVSVPVMTDAFGVATVAIPIPPEDIYHDVQLYAQFVSEEQPQNTLMATDGLDILMRGYSVPKPAPDEPAVPGTTFYVNSATGDDANDGLTAGTPFLTLARSISVLDRTGGDRLIVEGTFPEEILLLNFNPDANAARPTVITAARDQNGYFKTAHLDGNAPRTLSEWPYDLQGGEPGISGGVGYLNTGLAISFSNHVFVSGLSIHGFVDTGVTTWGSNDVTLSQLDVQWIGRNAMFLSNTGFFQPPVQNVTVAHCTIDNANLGRYTNYPSGYSMKSECLTLAQIQNYEVYGVHLSNSFMEGICAKPNSSGSIRHCIVENTRSVGIYVNESSDCEVSHNVVRATGYFFDGASIKPAIQVWANTWPAAYSEPVVLQELGATGILAATGDLGIYPSTGNLTNVTIRENTIAYTRKNGLVVWNDPAAGATMDNVFVDNNVVWGACQNPGISQSALVADRTLTDSSFTNNIVAFSGKTGANISGSGVPASGTLLIGNNLFFNNQPGIGGCASYNCSQSQWWGAGAIHADPLFLIEPAGVGTPHVFQLWPDSPAVDSGLSNGLIETGPHRDRGAFERATYEWQPGPQ